MRRGGEGGTYETMICRLSFHQATFGGDDRRLRPVTHRKIGMAPPHLGKPTAKALLYVTSLPSRSSFLFSLAQRLFFVGQQASTFWWGHYCDANSLQLGRELFIGELVYRTSCRSHRWTGDRHETLDGCNCMLVHRGSGHRP
jgi:hypothetical protein